MVGNCVTHYWLANKVRRPPFRFSPLSTWAVHFICFSNSNPPQPKLQTIINIKVRFSSIFIPLHISLPLKHDHTLMAQKDEAVHDQLADSLNDLFTSVSTMIKSQLQVLSLSLSNCSFL